MKIFILIIGEKILEFIIHSLKVSNTATAFYNAEAIDLSFNDCDFMSPGKVYNQQLLEQKQMHGVNNLDLDS